MNAPTFILNAISKKLDVIEMPDTTGPAKQILVGAIKDELNALECLDGLDGVADFAAEIAKGRTAADTYDTALAREAVEEGLVKMS